MRAGLLLLFIAAAILAALHLGDRGFLVPPFILAVLLFGEWWCARTRPRI